MLKLGWSANGKMIWLIWSRKYVCERKSYQRAVSTKWVSGDPPQNTYDPPADPVPRRTPLNGNLPKPPICLTIVGQVGCQDTHASVRNLLHRGYAEKPDLRLYLRGVGSRGSSHMTLWDRVDHKVRQHRAGAGGMSSPQGS